MHVLPLISTCSGTLPVHPTCFAGTLSPPSFSGKLRPAKNICLPSPQISAALLHLFPPEDFKGMHTVHCALEYREHFLHYGVFLCNEGVPSSKVDEDCAGHVRLQKFPNVVVVFQPVMSEKGGHWCGFGGNFKTEEETWQWRLPP